MHKFVLDNGIDKTLLLILKPDDLRQYREKPADDYSRIDGNRLGIPGVVVLLTYAANRQQMRQLARKLRVEPPDDIQADADAQFSAMHMGEKIIGTILSERTLRLLESEPLHGFVELNGVDFDVPKFKVLVTYATDLDIGALIRYLEKFGISREKINSDPTMRPLLEDYARSMLKAASILTGQTVSEPVEITIGHRDEISEETLLGVRGQELAWFAAHPTEREYLRRAVPGEFPPEIDATWVKVVRTDNVNIRARIPMKQDASGVFVEWGVSH